MLRMGIPSIRISQNWLIDTFGLNWINHFAGVYVSRCADDDDSITVQAALLSNSAQEIIAMWEQSPHNPKHAQHQNAQANEESARWLRLLGMDPP